MIGVDIDLYFRLDQPGRDAIVGWIDRNGLSHGSIGVTAVALIDESGRTVRVRRYVGGSDGVPIGWTTNDDGERVPMQADVVVTANEPFPVHVLAGATTGGGQ